MVLRGIASSRKRAGIMNQGSTPNCACVSGSFSRREFLERSGLGLGSLALAYLLQADAMRSASASQQDAVYNDLRARPGHFPGKAKAVIQLYQEGGPSQMDLFDPKPELTKHDGQKDSLGVESLV